MSADCTPQGARAASAAPRKITTRAMPEARIANCSKASRLRPGREHGAAAESAGAGHATAERQSISITSMVAMRADTAHPDDLVDDEAAQRQIAAEAGSEDQQDHRPESGRRRPNQFIVWLVRGPKTCSVSSSSFWPIQSARRDGDSGGEGAKPAQEDLGSSRRPEPVRRGWRRCGREKRQR